MTQTRPYLSIVVPMYNEAGGIPLFVERVLPIVQSITSEWEMVWVNDGSRDETFEVMKAFHHQYPQIKLINLSRNFGKEAALTAGLHHASGLAVIPMDADLQDPPELLPELVAKWQEGFKVVLATRRKRTGDSFMKRLTAMMFYKILRRMTKVTIPQNTGDFRLMDAQVIEALRHMPERTRFMKGIFTWVGFPTTQIFYDRPERAEGKSKLNFFALWQLAIDGIVSFTTVPLRVWTYLGAVIALFSLVYAVFLIIRTFMEGVAVPGYASLMTAVLFMGGVQLLSLGIIGEYVGRIYRETKHRPIYIIQEAIGFNHASPRR